MDNDMKIHNGWLNNVTHIPSPHHDERPTNTIPSLLVIHNISLPPGQFGGPYINQLFTGTLNPDEHPFFNEIKHLRVSAHCLIRRDGTIIQYVPFIYELGMQGSLPTKAKKNVTIFLLVLN